MNVVKKEGKCSKSGDWSELEANRGVSSHRDDLELAYGTVSQGCPDRHLMELTRRDVGGQGNGVIELVGVTGGDVTTNDHNQQGCIEG